MPKTPWNSIAESIVKTETRTLNHKQALESPCTDCPNTPCCTHLPLNTFKVTNMVELDHALYLLNFNNIELSISATGDWSSYYTYPCRYLDRETYLCKVHATPEQPRICQHYNPYNCWYRRAFSVGQNENSVRISRERMQYLLPYIEFNEERKIASVPAWDDLIALMEGFDDTKKGFEEPNFEDPVLAEWQVMIEQPEEANTAAESEDSSYSSISDPCDGCSAACCTTLVFPQSVPQQISNLDYFQFCLGFPGIELGISDGGWSLIVKTRCQLLNEDNRCAIYESAERPLICKYYDAWKCDYKSQFGTPRPSNYLRLRLEQFAWLLEVVQVDQMGALTAFPPTQVLRQYIESRWWGSELAKG
jgi:Fe-S-cluster containining protein